MSSQTIAIEKAREVRGVGHTTMQVIIDLVRRVSGSGQLTEQRLKAIVDYGATVLICTPTYALHMAETVIFIADSLARFRTAFLASEGQKIFKLYQSVKKRSRHWSNGMME